MAGFVLLHGFTGDASMWAQVELSLETPTLAPTLVGHEGVEATVRSFEEEVDRLAALVEARGYAGSHLCGYSLGGRVAIGLLVRHEHLFSAATLIGATAGLQNENERAERRADDRLKADLLLRQGVDAFIADWESQPIWATQATVDANVLQAQRRMRGRHSAEGLASALRVLGLAAMPDYWPLLPSIRVPVTIVAGERDAKFVAVAQRLGLAIPSSRVAIAPGVGHNVVLESPRWVSELLRGVRRP